MDWGTLVADWKGNFHDVSKNAFDSLATSFTPALQAGNDMLNNKFEELSKQIFSINFQSMEKRH